MQQCGTNEETAAPVTVTVLPTDTLLCALRVMERHQLRLLPVVEETGALLGLISETHILEAWGEDPLRLVSEVMAECGQPGGEEAEEALGWCQAAGPGWGEQAYGS
ncbi:CBS domain-containing protein [Hyalangium sp.]|uniref:CBS domain-containing protein n=1 Tax=Hyalangium sp. TaxID=2028555 RepID=UPI002D510E14|nr:CBS domain-containing protein [Hyalangium sp.]HYH97543.1 CBS domain-containing protein [Hyalangium sp.]